MRFKNPFEKKNTKEKIKTPENIKNYFLKIASIGFFSILSAFYLNAQSASLNTNFEKDIPNFNPEEEAQKKIIEDMRIWFLDFIKSPGYKNRLIKELKMEEYAKNNPNEFSEKTKSIIIKDEQDNPFFKLVFEEESYAIEPIPGSGYSLEDLNKLEQDLENEGGLYQTYIAPQATLKNIFSFDYDNVDVEKIEIKADSIIKERINKVNSLVLQISKKMLITNTGKMLSGKFFQDENRVLVWFQLLVKEFIETVLHEMGHGSVNNDELPETTKNILKTRAFSGDKYLDNFIEVYPRILVLRYLLSLHGGIDINQEIDLETLQKLLKNPEIQESGNIQELLQTFDNIKDLNYLINNIAVNFPQIPSLHIYDGSINILGQSNTAKA